MKTIIFVSAIVSIAWCSKFSGIKTTEHFDNALELDAHGNYLLFWNFNNSHVTFEVHVKTKGRFFPNLFWLEMHQGTYLNKINIAVGHWNVHCRMQEKTEFLEPTLMNMWHKINSSLQHVTILPYWAFFEILFFLYCFVSQ
jgi:hypothetical protein